MHIRQLQLQSYGPFENSGPIEFRRGINLIVGQNNSGKSALLRSLRSDWPNWPHRNLQRYRAHDLLPSQQFIRLAATGDELRRALLSFGNAAQYWPIPTQPDDLSSEKFAEEYLLPAKEYDFDFVRQQATGASKPDAERPTHNLFDVVRYHLQITATPPTITVNGWNQGNQDSGPNIANAIFNQNLFRFDAERLNVGRSAQQDVDDLAPNAANLPAVLQTMRGRRPRLFDQLVARVREILPSIYSFTPASVGTSETEILVWPTESMDNPEHGFALNESGTGVAQVIAILTAVLTRTDAVIVIDEINSFLHPAAAKALIRILKAEHGDHQYIISTHSAEVISASQPNSLYVIKRDGFESSAHPVSTSSIDELRDLSDLLGISIGDIFAADHVLWVEGRTEELCFPFLLNFWEIDLPTGLVISPVAATGDFIGSRRDVELLFSVYDRLSRVTLPLVKSIAFTFDSEELSDPEKTDLQKRAGGRLLFLPARHLECFALSAPAIADLINEYDTRDAPIDSASVEAEILRIGGDAKYKASDKWNDRMDAEWSQAVDAARLISDVVQTLTKARVSFEKTRHTLKLLQSTLKHEPVKLDPVCDYLRSLMALLNEKPK